MASGSPYRDSSGRTLEDYPRPSVAVDTAVLTIQAGRLAVLLAATGGKGGMPWALPGTFLHPGETLAVAVRRALAVKAGLDAAEPRQLRVFDDPARDDRGWVLSVAHVAAVRADRIPATDHTAVVPVDEVPDLPYDHGAIIGSAVAELRAAYRAAPDPEGLLPEAWDGEPAGSFTVRDLRGVHEAVLGERFNSDTFRRTMLPMLRATGASRRGARGKPAELYVRGSAADA